ncbi:MAG: CHASE2 domain-containing protein [Spirochaetaceae bacterium]
MRSATLKNKTADGDGRFRHRVLRGLAVGVCAGALGVAAWALGALETIEYRTWDSRVRFFAEKAEQHEDIAMILLDQDSLDWTEENFGFSFPWPREIYAYIVGYLERAGIKALAMDVLFVDPSVYGVYDDEQLGNALSTLPNDVFALFLGEETGNATAWPESVPQPEIAIDGLAELPESTREALSYPRGLFPIPEIAENASFLANVQNPQDSDGVFRRGPVFSLFDEVVVPGLGLATYLMGNDLADNLSVVPGELNVGNQVVPLDKEGNLVLRFKDRGESRTYGAAAVLNSELQLREGGTPDIDPANFAGKYVFFGFSAPGLLDLRPTPLNPTTPGVEVHANLLDNLLTGDGMRLIKPPAVATAIFLVAVMVGIVGSVVTGAGMTALLYGIVIPLPVFASFGAYAAGLWLPLVAIELGAVLSLIGSNVVNYATEGRQKRFIKGAFSQYLSPAVIDQLISHPERLQLGGERRELSIFFSDLQGFTSISESLSPEELTTLLNDYLSAMTDIIQEEGGTIDKYEGDAIIAFWNAPLLLEDHGVRGVRAAVRCQQKLAELRPEFARRSGKELHMRIGMNSGPAVVGNMGSRVRFDYTMLGDAVNLAARLEGINKQFGTYTMISEATRTLAGDAFACREISRVRVVGKNLPVVVYEPMTREEFARRRGHLEVFDRGRNAFYRGNFAEALAAFQEIADVDPPAEKYAVKCRPLVESTPGDWDGVWNMTEK